jgi:type IV conjugative transfer system lipoprotein TraV
MVVGLFRTMGVIILGVWLVGCAPHKMSFECQGGKGVGCKSLSQVNQIIDDKSLDEAIDSQAKRTKKICKTCEKSSKPKPQSSLLVSPALHPQGVFRTQEKVMRVWFNSHFDENQNFHAEHYVFTVIEPARWGVP